MTKMELIEKKNNEKYNITLFGRIICAQIKFIEKLVDHYWKIKAIDSIKLATANEVNSDQQFVGLINTLIEDHDVKRLLLSLYSLGAEKTDIITTKNGY